MQRRRLGRTGLVVSPVGLAPGGGDLPAKEVERAVERGVNYLYWGSLRGRQFRQAIRAVGSQKRDGLVLVVQTYSRAGALIGPSLERALRALRTDYVDVLLLGWWNSPPPPRIVDAVDVLRARGLVKHMMVSCHDRPTFRAYAEDPKIGSVMVRYNAAHPGAEQMCFHFFRALVNVPASLLTRPRAGERFSSQR